jgi:hypothetical protein
MTRNRGLANGYSFAYVDFVTPEAQALAVGLSEKVLEGRKLLIKLGECPNNLAVVLTRVTLC